MGWRCSWACRAPWACLRRSPRRWLRRRTISRSGWRSCDGSSAAHGLGRRERCGAGRRRHSAGSTGRRGHVATGRLAMVSGPAGCRRSRALHVYHVSSSPQLRLGVPSSWRLIVRTAAGWMLASRGRAGSCGGAGRRSRAALPGNGWTPSCHSVACAHGVGHGAYAAAAAGGERQGRAGAAVFYYWLARL